MKSLCIIPARGGSKRIPRKNVKDFLGKPIIAYSIDAALKSGEFDEVMVSTDDVDIARIATEQGAKVPFMRSDKTANDFATTSEVIVEVIDEYRKLGKEFDTVTCIYATAPFVTSERLTEALDKIKTGEGDSAFACVEFSYPIQRSLRIDKDGKIAMKWPEYRNSRSQDLEKSYHDAGQFYVSRVDAFQKTLSFWGDNTLPIVLSELEVQDLDTPTDWAIAEMKYQLIHNG